MDNRIIGATFDDQDAAFEAAQDVQDLERRGAIKIKRGAIVTKDTNGTLTIPDAKHVGNAWGLLEGVVTGTLTGLLTGSAGSPDGVAAGLTVGAAGDALSDGPGDDQDDQLLHEAISGIEPGQTVLVAEVDGESTAPVVTAVTSRGGRLFRTNLEVTGKIEQVRQQVQRDLAARRAKIEHGIEADEAQQAWENDTLKENDIKVVDLMTTNQQSEYDVYANSQGRASTRPLDE